MGREGYIILFVTEKHCFSSYLNKISPVEFELSFITHKEKHTEIDNLVNHPFLKLRGPQNRNFRCELNIHFYDHYRFSIHSLYSTIYRIYIDPIVYSSIGDKGTT